MSEGIEVRVENRLIRFIPAHPVNQARVESDLGGVRAGDLVVVALSRPSATVIVDTEGRLIVHGTHRVEAAQAAAKEILIRLGADDASLSMEFGPIIASFQYRRATSKEGSEESHATRYASESSFGSVSAMATEL